MKKLKLINNLSKYFLSAIIFTALFFTVSTIAQTPSENPLLSRRVPHPLYVFWTRGEFVNDKYLRDLDKIRAESPFDEVIISFRPYDDYEFWANYRYWWDAHRDYGTQNNEFRGRALTRIGETDLPTLRPIVEIKRDTKIQSIIVNLKLINESKTPISAQNVRFFIEQFPSATVNKISSKSAPNNRNLVAEQSFSFTIPTSNFRLVTRIDAKLSNHNLSFRTIVNVPKSGVK